MTNTNGTPKNTNSFARTTVLAVAGILAVAAAPAQRDADRGALATPSVRAERRSAEARAFADRRNAAHAVARMRGWKTESARDGFELMDISASGVPVYFRTLDVNAAISNGSMELQTQGIATGSGVKIGLWDQGIALASHQEFGSRVRGIDSTMVASHSTAVAGVLAAAGVNAGVRGNAPAALVDSYTWGSDVAEMIGVAMAAPGESGKIQISNHSYGSTHGWALGTYSGSSTAMWHWFGAGYTPDGRNNLEDPNFGAYGSRAGQFDQIAWDAPYYLQVRAAGNNRNDAYGGPRDGTGTFYYIDPQSWMWMPATWNAATAPADGSTDMGGYDTIITEATAKNVLTVGSVTDAVLNGVRTPSVAVSSSFSAWGPADDGRIKPDVVANGDGLAMPTSSGVSSYGSSSGTSFSAPGAAGVAAQIVQEAAALLPGATLRASTIKALLIHGATDIGTAGPDYKFGWGLVDAVASIEPLIHQAAEPTESAIVEATLNNTTATSITRTVSWDGTSDFVATICWTDPAGSAEPTATLDDRSAELVHDLDLRVTVGGIVHMPFKLNPAAPDQPATRGDNAVDNVEQVRIPAGSATPGNVQIAVTRKGSLREGSQTFSLVVSGQDTPIAGAPVVPIIQGVSPASAESGATVAITVAADTMPEGATLALVRDGRTDVLPSSTTISGGSVTGSFSLNKTEPGTWTVRLLLPGNVAVSAGSFEVRTATVGTLFSDTFDNSRASKANWTLSGASVAKVSGATVLKLAATNSATAAIPTTGKGSLMLSCVLSASSFESADRFFVELSTNGGSTWQTLKTISANQGATAAAFQLPAAAENNAAVRVRFRMAGDSKDTATVDSVLLSGTNLNAW